MLSVCAISDDHNRLVFDLELKNDHENSLSATERGVLLIEHGDR
jgi:hypothetical protein